MRIIIILSLLFLSLPQKAQKPWDNGELVISENGHYLCHTNGTPFFWQGDTSWLLFQTLTREEAKSYFENRKSKGFNVIQCIFHQSFAHKNAYGDFAFANGDITQPIHTQGNRPEDPIEYDYWDHVNYIIDMAEQYGIYLAIAPTWSQFVLRDKTLTKDKAAIFAASLCNYFKDKPNIIWLNGGSAKPNSNTEIWNVLGSTMRQYDPKHLITMHTFGRMQSSDQFHHEKWLDINMFTSGHRNYSQDDSPKKYGEDNWRYVLEDWEKSPAKPTIDGEPSYENLHHGLHDHSLPVWRDNDVRRYAYWSVFAGACGHVYGENSVRQLYIEGRNKAESGAKISFFDALEAPGASQIQYLRKLVLSRPYFERKNAQDCVINQGERYDRIIVSKGTDYLMAYDYTGRNIKLKLGEIRGTRIKVWWYDPTTGEAIFERIIKNRGIHEFMTPKSKVHTDWVLVLDNEDMKFDAPGIIN